MVREANSGSGEHPGPAARPRIVNGYTEKVETGHGNLYVTVNSDADGKPFEVFGNQGKSGGCDSAMMEAITRLASLNLRSGVPVENIVDQLKGITCCPVWDEGVQVRSGPDAIALVLGKIIPSETGPETP